MLTNFFVGYVIGRAIRRKRPRRRRGPWWLPIALIFAVFIALDIVGKVTS